MEPAMSNSEAYRKGLTGRAVRNPYPSGSSEWKSWNLGKAGRGRRKLKIKPKGPVLVRQGTTLHGKTYPAPKRKAPMNRNPMRSKAKAAGGPYWIVKEGRKLYHKTQAAAREAARRLANATGRSVTVHRAAR